MSDIKAMNYLRAKRNEKLAETDHYMISDWPITDEKREEWKIYRQKLRDLPSNSEEAKRLEDGSLINVTWPTKPT